MEPTCHKNGTKLVPGTSQGRCRAPDRKKKPSDSKISRVLEPKSVILSDLEAWEKFGTEILGLQLVDRREVGIAGRHRARCNLEHHNPKAINIDPGRNAW